jgi:hypothetical protein
VPPSQGSSASIQASEDTSTESPQVGITEFGTRRQSVRRRRWARRFTGTTARASRRPTLRTGAARAAGAVHARNPLCPPDLDRPNGWPQPGRASQSANRGRTVAWSRWHDPLSYPRPVLRALTSSVDRRLANAMVAGAQRRWLPLRLVPATWIRPLVSPAATQIRREILRTAAPAVAIVGGLVALLLLVAGG